MKNRKIIAILILSLSFSLHIGASESSRLFERSEFSQNKFQDSFQKASENNSNDDNGSLRSGGITPGEPATPIAPIGDAVWLTLGLGLAYSAYLFSRKRSRRF
jgi:hypothetical protein